MLEAWSSTAFRNQGGSEALPRPRGRRAASHLRPRRGRCVAVERGRALQRLQHDAIALGELQQRLDLLGGSRPCRARMSAGCR